MRSLAAVLLLVSACATQAPLPVPPEPPPAPHQVHHAPHRVHHRLTPLERRAFDYVLSPDATPGGIEVMRDILREHNQ